MVRAGYQCYALLFQSPVMRRNFDRRGEYNTDGQPAVHPPPAGAVFIGQKDSTATGCREIEFIKATSTMTIYLTN